MKKFLLGYYDDHGNWQLSNFFVFGVMGGVWAVFVIACFLITR